MERAGASRSEPDRPTPSRSSSLRRGASGVADSTLTPTGAADSSEKDGGWDFVPSGVQPSFGLRDDHSGFSSDDDSDASDIGDDKHIVTANGTFSYTEDWNHIERS